MSEVEPVSLVIQIKSEQWNGEFGLLQEDAVYDNSVLIVCSLPPITSIIVMLQNTDSNLLFMV